MQGSTLIRLLSAAVLALHLLGQTTEAAGVRACPHHAATAASADAGHAHGGAHSGGSDPESSAHDSPCTCLGACVTAAAVAVPSAAAPLHVGLATPSSVPAPTRAVTALAPQLRLPPAIGPPATSA